MIINKLRCVKSSLQTILVTNDRYSDKSATLETFEKTGDVWERVFPPMNAVLGKNGFTCNKIEGDGKSPIGVYKLQTCFGKYPNPSTLLPYRQTTENDTWVDDVDSLYYNTWQVNPAYGRWSSGEVLRPEDGVYYDYSIVINYNTADRIPGRGSAIFLHIWEGPDVPTFGCIAVEYDNLLKIIRWLNPSSNPIIIQGPMNEVLRW
ncbi:ErfK/YbiS/YcfS/YnhG family protein [Pseudobacteroides cellulosolvens ATCC 35603 = DSM 2933]|uniref:ErfK/YbiS/YcfS/YnhG family protein n=2 Tax=Pseudobacteroides cellulosolvens TaxID=35825 RepID=A0A0L6JKP6_9FIRM|nr:L,D-transpeptidase family protein [Pseudobacteroides cellulosolvens]KNY25957.1 ErfK/YbiS/YcfS/YnhG family protein [Pseudobacteroides cellulosolvens ATCC 35603 = DSM 2933]